MTTPRRKKKPTLTQAFQATLDSFPTHPRARTLAGHLAATVSQALHAAANQRRGPLAARSAVDVLTDNELAQTIADLKAAAATFA